MAAVLLLLFVLAGVLVLWGVGARARLLELRGAALVAFAKVESRLHDRHERVFHLVADATSLLGPQSGPLLSRLTQACDEAEQVLQAPRRAGPLPPVEVLEAVERRIGRATQGLLDAAAPHVIGDERLRAVREFARRDADIAQAVHGFNGSVRRYNTAVGEWPTRWVAAVLRLHPLPSLPAPEMPPDEPPASCGAPA